MHSFIGSHGFQVASQDVFGPLCLRMFPRFGIGSRSGDTGPGTQSAASFAWPHNEVRFGVKALQI